MPLTPPDKINIQNKKAAFDYELLERFTAGIQLTGSEIKSIRQGGGSIHEAYCIVRDGEIFIKGMNIPEYEYGAYANHVPTRLRKLLLRRREINRIASKIKEKGLTLVPVRLFINERGYAKLEIALARGKKSYDKRETIKQKTSKREMERALKRYR
ncbi:MAG: SsrA-binding protein SmpB [Chitinophagales bacterium]|nr:SsrA-binding protein SmpB [Chitinophagales bacterium]MDW8417898.1 SsrA-binding protein SmpB [Chitinophagales bacterium]